MVPPWSALPTQTAPLKINQSHWSMILAKQSLWNAPLMRAGEALCYALCYAPSSALCDVYAHLTHSHSLAHTICMLHTLARTYACTFTKDTHTHFNTIAHTFTHIHARTRRGSLNHPRSPFQGGGGKDASVHGPRGRGSFFSSLGRSLHGSVHGSAPDGSGRQGSEWETAAAAPADGQASPGERREGSMDSRQGSRLGLEGSRGGGPAGVQVGVGEWA